MFDKTDPLWLGPYAVDPLAECDNLFSGMNENAPDLDAGETFSVYDFDGPGYPAAHITDFLPETDALYIQVAEKLDHQTGAELLHDVAVVYDPQADLTRITLDGSEVATLEGDHGLSAEAITLVPMP